MGKMVVVSIDFKIDWDGVDRPISELQKDLDAAVAAGATHLRIYSMIGLDDYSYIYVDPIRQENAQERSIRWAKEIENNRILEKEERDTLAWLKTKYEV